MILGKLIYYLLVLFMIILVVGFVYYLAIKVDVDIKEKKENLKIYHSSVTANIPSDQAAFIN